MSEVSDRVSQQARFSAREFVARWYRETGEAPSMVVSDRMLFVYEMGYLRGRSDGADEAKRLFDKVPPICTELRKESDDDAK